MHMLNRPQYFILFQKENLVRPTQGSCIVHVLRDRQRLSMSKALKDFSTPSPLWATSKRKSGTHNTPTENSQSMANHTMISDNTNNVQLSVAHGSNAKELCQPLKHQEKEEGSTLQDQCLLNNSHESVHSTSTNIKIICYMCSNKLVYGDDIVNHLLFSPLRCRFCKDMINSCYQLRDRCSLACQCPARQTTTSSHDYSEWLKPMDNLVYFIKMDLRISKYFSNITVPLTPQRIQIALETYIRSLLPIRGLMPWKAAFTDFTAYIPRDLSRWPPPLPRLGWVISSESIAVQNKDKEIVNCTSDMPGNRKVTPEPHTNKATHTPSQIIVPVDNTGLHGTKSSQPLTSNTPPIGQQKSHQGVVKIITREQPSLHFKTVKQSLPMDCTSKPTKIDMDTSGDKVKVLLYKENDASLSLITTKDIHSPTGNDKAAGLSSFCKKDSRSPIKCSSPIQNLEKKAKSAIDIIERCISPDLYNNQNTFSSQSESPGKDSKINLIHQKNDLDFVDMKKNDAESEITTRECTGSMNFEHDEPNTFLSKNPSHHLTTESSNSNSPDAKVTTQPDRSEFSSILQTKQLTCSKSVSIPRPVVTQDSNESDSQMTCLPNRLQSETSVIVKEIHSSNPVSKAASVVSQDEESTNPTVHLKPTLTAETPNGSISDSRQSTSPEKPGKKRRRKRRKPFWTTGKQKAKKKSGDITSDEDEDGTMSLKRMKFVTKEDLASKRFLVIQWPSQPCPEECPECYCILTSELITLNISYFSRGRVACPDCNLGIYIVKSSPV